MSQCLYCVRRAGALGKHVARVALSQFPGCSPVVTVIPQVSTEEQLPEVLDQVAERKGMIIHTMVDPKLRAGLEAGAAER
ncbi:MAG: kinase/pyrophosphorylase, partial [Oscillochloris sp.]|nr:kinase/pyrophosphorylase [Oscillochloris sp.]